MRIALRGFLACLSLTVGSAASAEGLVTPGMCAVVVASRQTVPEVRDYIAAAGIGPRARVYLSSNGWYAITVGEIVADGAKEVVRRMWLDGMVPIDTFCSTGSKFTRTVAIAGTAGPEVVQGPAPLSTDLEGVFDARPLSLTERRFLQAALALAGHYSGALDGEWGPMSQNAMEDYARASFGADPLNIHAAELAGRTFLAWEEEGWQPDYDARFGVSMVLPMDKLHRVETWEGVRMEHADRDLSVAFSSDGTPQMAARHADAVSEARGSRASYTRREPNRWITAVDLPGGSGYLRSDRLDGRWKSVFIRAGRGEKGPLALIAGSLSVGPPPPIVPEENGYLVGQIFAYLDSEGVVSPRAFERHLPSAPEASVSRDVPPEGPLPESVGTGFFVTRGGAVLTNAHVVRGCRSITVGGAPAELVAVSRTHDLAALQTEGPALPLRFARDAAGLNADILIAGYPLYGILGGLNVSRGSVSSMSGLAGTREEIQISAPVQPGNSGGPVVDRYGNVVGVVVSKLDAMALAERTGDIAQNVNFAVRGDLAKEFLSDAGIAYEETASGEVLLPEDAAMRLQAATRLVACD